MSPRAISIAALAAFSLSARLPLTLDTPIDAVIETDIDTHVEVPGNDRIRLYGAKETEVTVRHKSGVMESYRIAFDKNTEVELAI